jgi:hypothetical protein
VPAAVEPVVLISEQEVAEDRAMAEAEMIDRGRITRPAVEGDPEWVEPVMDPDTLQYPEVPRVIVFEGRCRVQVRSDINSNAVEVVAGDIESTYRTSTVQLPMEPADDEIGHPGAVRSDQQLEILESPLDPTRVGSVLNLQADTKSKTLATHRRFRAREGIS